MLNRRIVNLFLTLLLFFSLLIPTSFADSTSSWPRISQNVLDLDNLGNDHDDTIDQLIKLRNLGFIEESIDFNNIKSYLPEVSKEYQEIEALHDYSSVILIDKNSNNVISVDEYLSTSGIDPSATNIYIVHFFSFVGNPDSPGAEYVHTGEVTNCFGLGCSGNQYLIQLNLQTSDYRFFGFINTEYKSDTVKKGVEVVLTYPINSTKYYKYKSVAYALEGTNIVEADSGESPSDLLNRYGKKYPLDYSDPDSGIRLYEPPANLNPNSQPRSSTFRSDFIKYYEENFGEPTQFSWDQVEIHHMRPLQYGGSNSMLNGIPLMNRSNSHHTIPKHSDLTRWWTYY